MFVDIDSADLHAQLEELFGRPSPTSRSRQELFGPYNLNGEDVFWRYTTASQTWDVLISDTDAEISSMDTTVPGEAYDDLLENIGHLRSLPRPGFPSTPNELIEGQTFTFDGWTFCWYWVPELGRWECARRGRA
jgi:hypothetical protein